MEIRRFLGLVILAIIVGVTLGLVSRFIFKIDSMTIIIISILVVPIVDFIARKFQSTTKW